MHGIGHWNSEAVGLSGVTPLRARDHTEVHATAAFEIIFPKNLQISLYFAYMFD